MKTMFVILGAIGLVSAAWAGEPSSVTNAHPELANYGFVYVETSPEQQKNLDTALSAVKLERKMDKACRTVEDARALLWRSISIATGGPRACTEYKGFFWFSRLDWARQDDRSFKSGFAVKKGTGEIHRWAEERAQPSGAANGFVPYIITPVSRDFKHQNTNRVELIDASKAATVTNGITLGQLVTNLGPGHVSALSSSGTIGWGFSDGRVLSVQHCTDPSTVLSSEPHARHRFWFFTNSPYAPKK
jgi:hypothetical protein